MAYFRNSAVNLLNLHYGIHSIVISSGGAFYAAYLLKTGVSAPGVLAAFALILGGRFVIRPIVIPLAVRWGMRPLVIAGTMLSAMQYPLLAEVHGIGWTLLTLCLISSLGDTVYWSSYHAYFAALGDHAHRGQQVSAREAIAAIVGIVSPLATGWALVAFGPRIAFGTAALVLLVAALPLLWTPDVAVARRAPGAFKAAIPGVLLFVADGWISTGFYFVWQIALFLSLGENFLAYGSALAVAALVGAISGLLLGRHIDAGHGARAAWLALGGMAILLALRAVAVDHVALAVIANALGSLSVCLYIPTLMTALYNQAKRAPRRRLGYRWRQRVPGRGDADRFRRAALGRHSPVAPRHGGQFCPAPALLSAGCIGAIACARRRLKQRAMSERSAALVNARRRSRSWRIPKYPAQRGWGPRTDS